MGRPAIVNTEALLQVAREMFLEQGFGVTTSAIARRANISEGSIFKRFSTKEELFFAALGIPEPTWTGALEGLSGQGEVEENLRQILLSIVEFFRELVPRMTMMWSCRALKSSGLQGFWGDRETPAVRGLRMLSDYLAREHVLGRLEVDSPEVAARTLLGSAQHYAFAEMMGMHLGKPLPAPEFVAGVIQLLCRGALPRATRPQKTRSSG